MQPNYFYLKNGVQVKGLGVALSIKKEFIKIEYLINLGLFKIEKSKYSFLRNDIVATTLPKLKIALKTEISNAWRDLIDEDNNQLSKENLMIKESLIENFKEFFFYAVIPETSLNPLRYVGGIPALNLRTSNSICSGDWHFTNIYCHHKKFEPNYFLYGENCLHNTNNILGNIEIIEISKILKKMNINFIGDKCYASTHCRAVADMVIDKLLNDKRLNDPNDKERTYITGIFIDEFLSTPEDYQRVINMLNIAKLHFNEYQQNLIDEWCKYRISNDTSIR